jgi:hypothetical protein
MRWRNVPMMCRRPRSAQVPSCRHHDSAGPADLLAVWPLDLLGCAGCAGPEPGRASPRRQVLRLLAPPLALPWLFHQALRAAVQQRLWEQIPALWAACCHLVIDL